MIKTISALDTLREELHNVQSKQKECVSHYGYIISSKRYIYQRLTMEAKEIKEGIELFVRLCDNKQKNNKERS